ncbi:MAG: SCP2 sterol-binding domain-containing protein [Burkholderiaceae bacterium]
MRLPDITLPPTIAGLIAKLPAAPPAWAWVVLLNQLMRRGVLPLDLGLLAGRRFEIRVLDLGLSLAFAADNHQFIRDCSQGEPDLCFSARLVDFARMMLREEDPDTLFFNRKLLIEGDTELGLIVKNLLDSLDWSNTPMAQFMTT